MDYSDDDKFLYDKEPPIPEPPTETERKVLELLGAGMSLEKVATMLLTKILRGERF